MNKKLILLTSAAILCLGNISESRAGCANNQTCGDDCCWSIDNGTLNITGSGKMDGYAVSTDQPWNSQKDSITAINVSGVDNIGYRAFQFLDKVNNVILSDSVKEVEHRAFWGNTLTSISMPNVTSIEDCAFRDATGLTSITLPDSVTSIGEEAFAGASSLTSITIPEGVTSIGNNAFADDSSLTSITIPDSVTSIGYGAFNYDNSLTNVICKGDVNSCEAMVNALPSFLRGKVTYPNSQTSCEGAGVSLYVWDSENEKCGRRNETQCNSVDKYYYNNGKCQVLPKTESACSGANIEWNDNKCVNKNYTPTQEANNDDTGGTSTGGDEIGGTSTGGDISGDFNPADCYNNGQVPYGGKCVNEYPFSRKHWTPAEAAKWLKDDDNFVVITFKK